MGGGECPPSLSPPAPLCISGRLLERQGEEGKAGFLKVDLACKGRSHDTLRRREPEGETWDTCPCKACERFTWPSTT